MPVSASGLRQNIYQLLDQVLETGVPLEIERKGRTLRIVADPAPSKLSRLEPHPDFIIGGDIAVAYDWTEAWDEEPEIDAP